MHTAFVVCSLVLAVALRSVMSAAAFMPHADISQKTAVVIGDLDMNINVAVPPTATAAGVVPGAIRAGILANDIPVVDTADATSIKQKTAVLVGSANVNVPSNVPLSKRDCISSDTATAVDQKTTVLVGSGNINVPAEMSPALTFGRLGSPDTAAKQKTDVMVGSFNIDALPVVDTTDAAPTIYDDTAALGSCYSDLGLFGRYHFSRACCMTYRHSDLLAWRCMRPLCHRVAFY
ncbi:hypothetical protein GQ42DRAFT_153814 [Ramicandelaber brevisporus]|nr:hypothetical protein GQ42DRAFT_153814 [Ramicandelaber brevisporus]